jgi:hypothetical protein
VGSGEIPGKNQDITRQNKISREKEGFLTADVCWMGQQM